MLTGARSIFAALKENGIHVTKSKNESKDSHSNNKEELSADDIPRDDLLQLCMKLNKRMQAMEIKGQDIVRLNTKLKIENRKFADFIESTSGIHINTDADEEVIDFENLKKHWEAWDSNRNTKLVQLEELTKSIQIKVELPKEEYSENKSETIYRDTIGKLKGMTSDIESLQNLKQQFQLDHERLSAKENSLRQTITALEQALREKSTKVEALSLQLETERRTHEEKIIYLQMQLSAGKSKDDKLERVNQSLKAQIDEISTHTQLLEKQIKEKDEKIRTTSELKEGLEHRIGVLEPQLLKAKEKLRDLEKNSNANTLMKAEQEALLTSMRRDLKAAVDAKNEAIRRSETLSKQASKAEELQHSLSEAKSHEADLQLTIDEQSVLVKRLRTELMTAEKNQALRTAAMAASETQIQLLQRQLEEQHDLAVKDTNTAVVLEKSLVEVQILAEQREKVYQDQLDSMRQEMLELQDRHKKDLEQLTNDQTAAIETIHKDYKLKIHTARSLLEARDDEMTSLKAQLQILQDDIRTGATSERRIFELAQQQANREATYGLHSDTRELAFHQLQTTLASRDLALARLQHAHTQLLEEVSELRRVKRREGINLDYLKNVVLQYMSFPTASPERSSLVPVISMLLQFNAAEILVVDKASNASAAISLWTNTSSTGRPVKEVKAIISPSKVSSPSNKIDMTNNTSDGSNITSSGSTPYLSTIHKDAMNVVAEEMDLILNGRSECDIGGVLTTGEDGLTYSSSLSVSSSSISTTPMLSSISRTMKLTTQQHGPGQYFDPHAV